MTDQLRDVIYLTGTAFSDTKGVGQILPQDGRDLIVTVLSVAAGIVAAGTSQGTATALTARWNIVTSVPSGTGVVFLGRVPQIVSNRGVNPLLAYPSTGVGFETYGANNPLTVPPGCDLEVVYDPNNWLQGYAKILINLATISSTPPTASGVPWLDAGSFVMSQ